MECNRLCKILVLVVLMALVVLYGLVSLPREEQTTFQQSQGSMPVLSAAVQLVQDAIGQISEPVNKKKECDPKPVTFRPVRPSFPTFDELKDEWARFNNLLANARDSLPDNERFNVGPSSISPPAKVLIYSGGIYTGWHVQGELRGNNYWSNGPLVPRTDCQFPCEISGERANMDQMDAVIFDVAAMGYADEYRRTPPRLPMRLPGQMFLWANYEPPDYFPMIAERSWNEMMDGEISYGNWTFIRGNFFCPWGGLNATEVLRGPIPVKRDPSKVIMFMNSNCGVGEGAVKRRKYIEELMKYISVDSYGHCLHNKDFPGMPHTDIMGHGERIEWRMRAAKEYRFVLSFENTDREDDYLSEKVWTTFLAGSLPIFWGSKNIAKYIPSPDSVIFAHYYTPKQLAALVNRINEDPVEYNKYFEWRNQPLSLNIRHQMDLCLANAHCRICKRVAQHRVDRISAGLPTQLNPRRAFVRNSALRVGDEGAIFSVPSSPYLELNCSSCTVAAWVYPKGCDFDHGARIIDKNKHSSYEGYNIDLFGDDGKGTPRLRFCGGGTCASSHRHVFDSEWTHFAIAKVGLKLKFYLNGEFDSEVNLAKEVGTTNYDFFIGRISYGITDYKAHGLFRGYIDELAFFNKELNEREISLLQYTRLDGTEPNLVAHWPLDELKTTLTKTTALVADVGPHNLHGTIFSDYALLTKVFIDVPERRVSSLGHCVMHKYRNEDFY